MSEKIVVYGLATTFCCEWLMNAYLTGHNNIFNRCDECLVNYPEYEKIS